MFLFFPTNTTLTKRWFYVRSGDAAWAFKALNADAVFSFLEFSVWSCAEIGGFVYLIRCWRRLIGVRENFLFSPQLLPFVLASQRKMTCLNRPGLGNEISELLYGLTFFNLPTREQPWDSPDRINGDVKREFLNFDRVRFHFIYPKFKCLLWNQMQSQAERIHQAVNRNSGRAVWLCCLFLRLRLLR